MTPLIEVTPTGVKKYPVFRENSTAAICAHLRNHWGRTILGPDRHAVVVADDTTFALFGDEVRAALEDAECRVSHFTFAPGEPSKTRATKARIEDAMLDAGVDRGGCIVAVGGGITLDLAGFIAATFMRGIAHINIATSLLAQVDAAIGGKTAINTPAGKNLVGAIHHPRGVYIHAGALATLPDVEKRCGLAEAVKHAVLSDSELFDGLWSWSKSRADLNLPASMLDRCIAIKAEVVAEDAHDRGKRNILNYGHTAAHAIELATDHETPHGYAVSMGMVIETRAAVQAGRFPDADLQRLTQLLDALELPTGAPCSFAEAAKYLSRDKKSVNGDIRCAIPARIGSTVAETSGSWTRVLSEQELEAAW